MIEWIDATMPSSKTAIIKNGDDAALLAPNHRGVLIATDMLLDGRHFITQDVQPELIGRKAVAVNFSDIAAMGGWPESLFISLAIPDGTSPEWIKRVMIGASELAREYDCGIDGGDTNSWLGSFAINVCVTGRPHWRGAVTRSGARANDVVMVSGHRLGNTLKSNHHLNFTPRLRESSWLMDHGEIHSMMDLSDGLATDLPRLAKASDKKFIIDAEKLLSGAEHENVQNSLRSALCDGEDFELLFTVDETTATLIEQEFPWACGVRRIGMVESGEGVFIRAANGIVPEELKLSGFEH